MQRPATKERKYKRRQQFSNQIKRFAAAKMQAICDVKTSLPKLLADVDSAAERNCCATDTWGAALEFAVVAPVEFYSGKARLGRSVGTREQAQKVSARLIAA